MSRRVYRWRVSPPPGSGFEAVEVLGASRYEAVIAAAKLWRTPWTQIARACTFERLGEVIENGLSYFIRRFLEKQVEPG